MKAGTFSRAAGDRSWDHFRSGLATVTVAGLLLLMVAIPFSLDYLIMRPAALSSLNFLSVGVILLGMFSLAVGAIPWTPVKDRWLWLPIVALMLAMAYALFFTHPLRNGLGLWTSRLLQPLWLGWLTYQFLAARRLTLSWLAGAFFLSLLLLIVGGALQLGGVIPFADPGRVTVLYRWPNTFARYAEILLLVTLPWIVFAWKRYRILGLLAWSLGFLLLLSSKSYNGTLSCAIALLVMVLCLPDTFRRLKQVVVAVFLLLALLVGINAPRLPKWQTSITDSRLTRLEFWQVAEGVIKDHFWTGIGIKGWETQYPNLVVKYGRHYPPLNWSSPQPHNVFLDSFVKAGLPGFLGIGAILLAPVLCGWRLLHRKPLKEEGWLGLAVLGYGLAMLLFGLIDDPLWSDDTVPVLFILLFAASWAASTKRE